MPTQSKRRISCGKGVQIARMKQLDDMCMRNVLPAPMSPGSEASPKDREMLCMGYGLQGWQSCLFH